MASSDWAAVTKLGLTLLNKIPTPSLQKFVDSLYNALVLAVVLSSFYCGFFIIRERDIWEGLKAAIFDSRSDALVRARSSPRITELLQAELRAAVSSDLLIDGVMQKFLDTHPGTARQRLAVFHNGIAGLSGMSLIKADIVNARAAAGRAAGEFITNAPLATWAEVVSYILKGECFFGKTTDLQNGVYRDQLRELGVVMSVACPIVDTRGQTLGVIFTHYDQIEAIPNTNEAKAQFERDITPILAQISAAWVVRGLSESLRYTSANLDKEKPPAAK